MGVAAMLRNQWTDRDFEIAAISERSAVVEEDDLVVIAAVDPQGLIPRELCCLCSKYREPFPLELIVI
jgi:hypothetical protein